MFLFYLVIGTL